MSREALVLLVCCCDFRDGAERLIPSKSLGNAVIRAFPGLFRILRMCAPRHAAAVVRPRERKKSADRRRRILISRLLIIRASVPRWKSPFPAYFKGFPAVSPLIPPYPAFLKYPVSPQRVLKAGKWMHIWDCDIRSAYPEPFVIDLDIKSGTHKIHTAYGIVKRDAQSSESVVHLLESAGLRIESLQEKDGQFHIQCRKDKINSD